MQNKKVSGERIAAALIDAVFVSIISLILITVPFVALFMSEGLDGIMDVLMGGTTFMDPTDTYINFIVGTSVAELIVGVLYFALIPYKMNGQTFGKKLLKIKVVNEFGENPSFLQHFFRAIQIWSSYLTVPFMFLIYVNYISFIVIVAILGYIAPILMIIAFIMLLSREDGRGLHDLITNTLVVRYDYDTSKAFVEKATQMSDWAEVVDEEDDGLITEINDDDNW